MKAIRLIFSSILTLLLMQSASTARTATNAEREIDTRMRLGYSAAEGERLKARRRKLEEARAKCSEVKS